VKTVWPKQFLPLSGEREAIRDDFVKYWHQLLPRYRRIEAFNHSYAVRHAPPEFLRTLEIGAGLGEHLSYERLTAEQRSNYFCLELRENMCSEIRRRFPEVQAVTADCQQRLPFPDHSFDRVLAVHVLEHLPNLPAAIGEVHRVCNKRRGIFSVVIPCEGGLAYGLARRLSAQRVFERRYRESYRWFIEREHINRPHEILRELDPYFRVVGRTFYPLRVPFVFCNLVIGLTLQPQERIPCSASS
jgi:SAM-dependent methyltransferase